MKVILLEKVVNLGGIGDQVNVKSGYGRNYLLPYGKAIAATAANVAEFEGRRAELDKKAVEKLAQAQKAAEQLQALTVISIAVKASEEGRLFGSVSNREIANALTAAGVEVLKGQIDIAEPIHATGDYEVQVRLHTDVVVTVKFSVVSEEG